MKFKSLIWAFLDRINLRIGKPTKWELALDRVPPMNVRELASSKGVLVTEARIDGKPFVYITNGTTDLWMVRGAWCWDKTIKLLKSGVFDD